MPSDVYTVDSAMLIILCTSEIPSLPPTNPPSPKSSHVYALHGHGTDGVGSFSIDGIVFACGKLWFTKVYADGLSWHYGGRLMPWGIVGRWDYGRFWIWKDVFPSLI